VSEEVNHHFKYFQASLKEAIRKYGKLTDEEFTTIQCEQIERLAAHEKDFRLTLVGSSVGEDVYGHFVSFIRDEKRNILMARPYFRERQDVFSEKISVALETRNVATITDYHVNYQFVSLVMRHARKTKIELPAGLLKIARSIEKSRHELVVMNLPLVIQRAKIFWGRTPKSHLSFMDLVQIGCEGLIAAVDKFVLPYSELFRSVAIGRMVGNFIEWYSDTLLHFFPSDRRKIYRANKVRAKAPNEALDFDELAAAVNEPDKDGNLPKDMTDSDEIADLVAAASAVSADVRVPGEPDVPSSVARYEAPPECRPDVQVEAAEASAKLMAAVETLPLLDRKLLRLKGIAVPLG
jgi:RNA polymerase sigma factor (sigma-70 family)